MSAAIGCACLFVPPDPPWTCVECLTLGKSFVPTLYGEGYPEDLKLGYGLSCAVRYWMSSVSRATPANIAAVVAAGSSEKRGEPEGPVWELRMWMEVACDTRRFARN